MQYFPQPEDSRQVFFSRVEQVEGYIWKREISFIGPISGRAHWTPEDLRELATITEEIHNCQ